jgi:predicted Zn-dependent protease
MIALAVIEKLSVRRGDAQVSSIGQIVTACALSLLAGCSAEGARELQDLVVKSAQSISPELGRHARTMSPLLGLAPLMDVSTEREVALAEEVSRDLDRRNRPTRDRELEEYVVSVFYDLVEVAGDTPYAFSLRVVESPQINAFTTGAGNIYITTGMLGVLESEAQLAMVLAHEIAHVLKRHVILGLRTDSAVAALGGTASSYLESSGTATTIPPQLRRAAYDYTQGAIRNGFSRADEEEADLVGLALLVQTGYAPEAAPEVFEVLARVNRDRPRIENFFHGSHPLAADRVVRLRRIVMDRYQNAAAPRGHGEEAFLTATRRLRGSA